MGNLNADKFGPIALAYMGDAVYEVYVRRHIMETGQLKAGKLHQMAIKYVCADNQAFAVKQLMKGFLSEEEIAIVKRARNHKTSGKNRGSSPVLYKLATAFEALIGNLYLNENVKRMEEIIKQALEIIESGEKKGDKQNE